MSSTKKIHRRYD
jgi:hypothetical protein